MKVLILSTVLAVLPAVCRAQPQVSVESVVRVNFSVEPCRYIWGKRYCGNCTTIWGNVYCAEPPNGQCAPIWGRVYCGNDCKAEAGKVFCDGKEAAPAKPAQPVD